MAKQKVIIELKRLTKRYGYGANEYYALRDFDLTVRQGEFIMIMGPSGCGKTTLLNMIGMLDAPTSGEYLLNGKPVAKMSGRRKARLRSREIGFIFQGFNLINNLPVIENVALPLVYSGYSVGRRLRMASDVLANFHLERREYYMPSQLSGGQQQRVAIARSLVAGPSIILADEPTGNLDSRTSHIVMEELSDIHAAGNTIIMVTHNPALLSHATRVINMLDGQIDTDEKMVADHDLPSPNDPEKVAVRLGAKRPLGPPVVEPVEVKTKPAAKTIVVEEPESAKKTAVTKKRPTKAKVRTKVKPKKKAGGKKK
jgi:putative ABC transport system ATP-binding protein